MLVLNKLVEVYFNGEFDKLSVGYIRKIDDEYIMLEEVDPRGFMDGYSFILKDNINIVKSDTEYLKGIEILMNVNSKENILNSYVFDHKEIKLEGENIFDDILKKLTGNKLPVTLLLPESEKVFGYISEISDDFVEVEYFEEKISVNKKDIINIYVNGVSQRSDILLDYEKRKLKK